MGVFFLYMHNPNKILNKHSNVSKPSKGIWEYLERGVGGPWGHDWREQEQNKSVVTSSDGWIWR